MNRKQTVYIISIIFLRAKAREVRLMTLFVVSTPIGNLEDFSFRAKNILQTVDLIAAEDKRKTSVLLARWSIEKPMIAMHDHNEKDLLEKMIGLLKSGKTIALVADAGTPSYF